MTAPDDREHTSECGLEYDGASHYADHDRTWTLCGAWIGERCGCEPLRTVERTERASCYGCRYVLEHAGRMSEPIAQRPGRLVTRMGRIVREVPRPPIGYQGAP